MKKTNIIILSIVTLLLILTGCNLDATRGIFATIAESQPTIDVKIVSAAGYKSDTAYFVATDGLYCKVKDGSFSKLQGNTSTRIIREAIFDGKSSDTIYFLAQNPENNNASAYYSVSTTAEAEPTPIDDSTASVIALSGGYLVKQNKATPTSYSITTHDGLAVTGGVLTSVSSITSIQGHLDCTDHTDFSKNSLFITYYYGSAKKACYVINNQLYDLNLSAVDYNDYASYALDDSGSVVLIGRNKTIYAMAASDASRTVRSTGTSVSATLLTSANIGFYYDAGTVGEGYVFKGTTAYHPVTISWSSSTPSATTSATTTGYAKNMLTTTSGIVRTGAAKFLAFTYENGLKIMDLAQDTNSSF